MHAVTIPTEPAAEAVPAADLRRAGVPGPQHLAALRRLVRRQSGAPEACACVASRPSWHKLCRRRAPSTRAREGASRERRSPHLSPATSPSSPCAPSRQNGDAHHTRIEVNAARGRRDDADGEGVFNGAVATSQAVVDPEALTTARAATSASG